MISTTTQQGEIITSAAVAQDGSAMLACNYANFISTALDK